MSLKLKARADGWKADGTTASRRRLRVRDESLRIYGMERRDYLLRQIEALGRILSRLRELISGGATAEANGEIQAEMRNAGLELAMANALDPATLRMLLGGQALDTRRAFTVGALLHHDGLRARADGDEAWAARSFRGAATLLAAARPSVDPERQALADQMLAEIADLTSPHHAPSPTLRDRDG